LTGGSHKGEELVDGEVGERKVVDVSACRPEVDSFFLKVHLRSDDGIEVENV
jgi:hypothetical protein